MADDLAGSSVEALLSPGHLRDSLRQWSSSSSTDVPCSPESSIGFGCGGGWHEHASYAKSCMDPNKAAREAVAEICRRARSRTSPLSHELADDTTNMKEHASEGFPSSAHARYRQDEACIGRGTVGSRVQSARSRQHSTKSTTGNYVAGVPCGWSRNTSRRRASSSPRRSKSSPRKASSQPPSRCVKPQQNGALASFQQASEAAQTSGIPFGSYSECRRASDYLRSEALRRLQASHQERAGELAEMAVRTASRIDACLSLDTEQARAQLAQEREARRNSELQRLQGEIRELQAFLGRVQPRVDNVLPRAYSRATSPVSDRSMTTSLSSETLLAHRRHLRELTSNAEARIDASLSPTTQEQRRCAAEQRSLTQSGEAFAMRQRRHHVRELVNSARPRVERELSPEAVVQRNDFDYARASARAHDYRSFATRSQDLRDLRETTPRRVETSLTPRTLAERDVLESSRLHRCQNRHRDMQEQHRKLRDLVAVRCSRVDAYIDDEVRAKIRKETPKDVHDAILAARAQYSQENEVLERAPMHHQKLWQVAQGTASQGQEQRLNKKQASQESLSSATTFRPSPCRSLCEEAGTQHVELELLAMQDQLRAKHQARERQNVTMLTGSARGAVVHSRPEEGGRPPVGNDLQRQITIGHPIMFGSGRPATARSKEVTSFVQDQRQQDVGSFVIAT